MNLCNKNDIMHVQLHNHSINSLLDGLISPQEMADKAKEMGYGAVAITDHGSISGSIKFYKACKKNNIKPIIGSEAYFVTDTTVKEKGEKRYHILLLAKNADGFRELCNLYTKAHEAFYYFPRMDMDMLCSCNNIIVSTACSYGILTHPNAERIVRILKDHFKDDFYLELMPLKFEQQIKTNNFAIELSKKHNIKTIITNDIHYLNKDDSEVHNFLLRVNSGGRLEFNIGGLYMKSPEEMYNDSIDIGISETIVRQSMEETLFIADKVNIELQEKDIELPILVRGDSFNSLKSKFDSFTMNGDYKSRLEYELSVIKDKGFSTYFLMVEDFISWCRNQGMELGAGRGSGAGSLMCYLLGITDVDPIKDGLSFERFLNPERSDWPDLDLDIPRSRRHEGIAYLKQKYGPERVANLSTVSRLQLRSAFKDVAKAYSVPFVQANNISKLLDNDVPITEMPDDSQVKKMIYSLDKGEEIVRMIEGISGTLRQSGTHAAGIVIAPRPIREFGILEKRGDDFCLNWDMDDIQFFGLVKLDVLGLRTLDIIGEAKSLIFKRHGKKIDWKKTEVDKKKILDEFGHGNTVGIFQFESNSMTRLVKQLKNVPSKSLLVDCNALGRPGPLDSGLTNKYVKRHIGEYCPFDEPYYKWFEEYGIAEDTYRVIIYQEQITEILQKLAGYSIPQADIVRRVIAKKKGDIEAHRQQFIDGCLETSQMPQEISTILFDNLTTFSRYGFNKSHAAAYTELALRQMWLKVNYPLEYMVALYRWTDESDKTAKFVDECNRLNIKILPPDINKSSNDFIVDGDSIRIGLKAIKGIGEKALSRIMKQRGLGDFDSLQDFRIRLAKSDANKTVVRNLVLTGCFDFDQIKAKSFVDNEEVFHELYGGKKKIPPDVRERVINDIYFGEDFDNVKKELFKASLMEGIYSIKYDTCAEINIADNVEKIETIQDIIKDCEMCMMYKYHKCPVPPEFHYGSRLMIIAEAPGDDETRQGRPLIGKAGQVLMEKLEKYSIMREDLYLTNIFKCRPLDNKLPTNPPLDCYEYLKKELEILQPKLVLALGGTAKGFFTGDNAGIMAKARSLKVHMEILDGKQIVPVVYSVHPASTFYTNGKESEEILDDVINFVSDIFYGIKGEKYDI